MTLDFVRFHEIISSKPFKLVNCRIINIITYIWMDIFKFYEMKVDQLSTNFKQQVRL